VVCRWTSHRLESRDLTYDVQFRRCCGVERRSLPRTTGLENRLDERIRRFLRRVVADPTKNGHAASAAAGSLRRRRIESTHSPQTVP
jgi:hypothetical protein